MQYVFLVILGLIIASINLGPLSHAVLAGNSVPNLSVITLWAFVWLTDGKIAYRWAIIIGLIFDIVSFLPFGFWTLLMVGLTYIALQLKERFFELSSLFQALLVLAIILGIWEIIISIASKQLLLFQSVTSIFYSVVLGAFVYYIFAVRFKLLQRWLGRRI